MLETQKRAGTFSLLCFGSLKSLSCDLDSVDGAMRVFFKPSNFHDGHRSLEEDKRHEALGIFRLNLSYDLLYISSDCVQNLISYSYECHRRSSRKKTGCIRSIKNVIASQDLIGQREYDKEYAVIA